MMAPAITLEALGLGRSPACCAFDGPSAPLPIRLELLAAAQAAVELHYSFPHPTPEFEAEARPILVKLIEAFDCRPDLSTILAVHAVLNRLVHADRLETEAAADDASSDGPLLYGLDARVARAMGASSHAYKRWRARLNKLRNQAETRRRTGARRNHDTRLATARRPGGRRARSTRAEMTRHARPRSGSRAARHFGARRAPRVMFWRAEAPSGAYV